MKNKQERGITLIALVVTIVVLLILAGVSISLVLNNNGVISKAKDAKNQYAEAQTNDERQLNEVSDWIDTKVGDTTGGGSVTKIDGVPIPAGFVYVGGTKDSGLVISDNEDDKEKYKGQTTAVNNIYDMGGNVQEFTTESCSDTGCTCTTRGGNCNTTSTYCPAGNRFWAGNNAYPNVGFRITLFL